MNKRPTPETDALVSTWTPVADVLDHARRLERERDEAREQAEELRQAGVANAQLHLELVDANATIAHRERELAEAREQAEEMREAFARCKQVAATTSECWRQDHEKMREAIREAGNALCACLDIIGSPETPPHMLWKTDDEINAAWHAGKAALAKLQPFLDQ